jgi:hypothetical protein
MKTLNNLCNSYEIASNKIVSFHSKMTSAKTEQSRESNEYKLDVWTNKITDIAREIEDRNFAASELAAMATKYRTIYELI